MLTNESLKNLLETNSNLEELFGQSVSTYEQLINEFPAQANLIIKKIILTPGLYNKLFTFHSILEFAKKLPDSSNKLTLIDTILENSELTYKVFSRLDGISLLEGASRDYQDKVFNMIKQPPRLLKDALIFRSTLRAVVNNFPSYRAEIMETISNDKMLEEEYFSLKNVIYTLDVFPEFKDHCYAIIHNNLDYFRSIDDYDLKMLVNHFPDHKEEFVALYQVAKGDILDDVRLAISSHTYHYLTVLNYLIKDLRANNQEDKNFIRNLQKAIQKGEKEQARQPTEMEQDIKGEKEQARQPTEMEQDIIRKVEQANPHEKVKSDLIKTNEQVAQLKNQLASMNIPSLKRITYNFINEFNAKSENQSIHVEEKVDSKIKSSLEDSSISKNFTR